MAEVIVKAGDTLSKIAKDAYGDASLARKLADFNGLANPNDLLIGQHLELPSKDELLGNVGPVPAPGPAAAAPAPKLVTPNGFDELIATFGDIRKFIKDDGTLDLLWEQQQLTLARLPFPIPFTMRR